MSEERDLKQATTVYQTLCDTLDDMEWRYKRDDEALTIHCGVQGDDLPMELNLEIDKKRKLVSLMSHMPYTVAENKRKELAIAVSRANYGMVDGCFDYDYVKGGILFRMTSSFRESIIGKGMLEYMILCACHTIDHYNDKFLTVAKSEMSYDEIMDFIE